MSPLHEIDNFLPIDARIGTSGQPSDAELGVVAREGYAAVINLGMLDPRYCLADEAGLVSSLGMEYRHIAVPFDAPTLEHLDAFIETMDAWRDRRVFVHCAANWRVSSFMALYGELRLGWTRERADAHTREFWELNECWTNFLRDGRAHLAGARASSEEEVR
jgi:protein tyrosine phosphatase (PTP) superfamily phosphohydrolase (DUF442 family)